MEEEDNLPYDIDGEAYDGNGFLLVFSMPHHQGLGQDHHPLNRGSSRHFRDN